MNFFTIFMRSEHPPAAHKKTAKEREEKERPNDNDRAPEPIFTYQSKQEKNRKHGQRISRHAFNESDADQQQPVSGYPGRVDRSQLEPAHDGADKAEARKN